MPEALAIAAVFVVVVVALVGAWLQERNPTQQDARVMREQLRQHADWLEQRQALARREHWGEDMIASLARARAATLRQLTEKELGQS